MKARRAISPVIAIIIIVAVTIAIAVAVAGWLMGLWGGYARGGPSLQITYAEARTDGNITVVVSNKGSGDAKVDKILVNGGEVTTNATATVDTSTTTITGATYTITIPQGKAATITIKWTDFFAGQNVNIEIIDTNSGARATASVPASP